MVDDGKLQKEDFNRILTEAIDESFSSLGNQPRAAIVQNLDAYFSIKEEDIPLNLAKFRDALETIFGSGTSCLEEIITTRLCEKLNLDPKNLGSKNLIICVDDVKKQLLIGSDSK